MSCAFIFWFIALVVFLFFFGNLVATALVVAVGLLWEIMMALLGFSICISCGRNFWGGTLICPRCSTKPRIEGRRF